MATELGNGYDEVKAEVIDLKEELIEAVEIKEELVEPKEKASETEDRQDENVYDEGKVEAAVDIKEELIEPKQEAFETDRRGERRRSHLRSHSLDSKKSQPVLLDCCSSSQTHSRWQRVVDEREASPDESINLDSDDSVVDPNYVPAATNTELGNGYDEAKAEAVDIKEELVEPREEPFKTKDRRGKKRCAHSQSHSLASKKSKPLLLDCGDGASEGGDEGEEEEEEVVADEGWSTCPSPPTVLPFTATPGLTVPIPTTPLGFIQLFLSFKLLRFIMEETNDYATYCRDELKQKSAYNWLGSSIVDIAQYLGLRIFMGICKLPVEHMYWPARGEYAPSCFAQTMTFNRFKQLSKYLHFYNRRALPRKYKDKLLPVKTIMEYMQDKCRNVYVPDRHLSLDEGMLPFKGRLTMKVYNPAKPDKYGIKFYMLCEATSGFVLDFSMYSGVSRTLREIVLPLCQKYFNQGYHVYMDNYYNSVSLTDELYSMGTHSSGTLRLARGAPTALKVLAGSKQPRDSLKFRRKGNTFIICWQDVRLVSLISNLMGVETEEYLHHKRIRTRGRTELQVTHLQRPLAIKEYIKHVRGVDRFDQKIKYYSFTRKTFKWTKKVMLYFLQMMLQNAHVLYLKYSTDPHKMTLLQFHEVAYDALIHFKPEDWPAGGTVIPHAADLPAEERHDRPAAAPAATPAAVPVASPATPAAPAATSATSAAAPASTSATPAAAPAATPAAATSATPAAAPAATPAAAPAAATSATPAAAPAATPPASPAAKRPRLVDTPGRLQAGRVLHTPEQFGGRRQLKRCRVCYMSGVRRETSYQCSICKIPLCIRGNCFQRYHSLRKYWRSPPGAAPVGPAPLQQ